MNKIEIFVHDDSDDYEYEFGIQKGYWDYVYVKKNEKFFRVNIITLTRLTQECQIDFETYNCYAHVSNIVIVDKATKESIVKTLIKQNEMGFFDNLAHCNSNGEILPDKNEEHWLSEGKKTFQLSDLKKLPLTLANDKL